MKPPHPADTCRHDWEHKLRTNNLQRLRCKLCTWWAWMLDGAAPILYRDRHPCRKDIQA